MACAFVEGELIGFASVENKFFGSRKEYLELSYIHISSDYRNRGLGKKLFNLICEKARKKGAKKLYLQLTLQKKHNISTKQWGMY